MVRGANRTDSVFADQITAAWNKTRDGILEAGRLLIEAKAALPHGAFTAMVENGLPFTARTAQILMKVAGDQRLTNTIHGSLLPPSWRTLYDLTKLDDGAWAQAIERGIMAWCGFLRPNRGVSIGEVP